ncbi:NnrS family protein [Geminicoccus harenae]|uniref:NnrS family protein n=1 Tax=Geminicoccus harenae TaxID=2498453 RepID=UPI00168BA6DF|nr:NnrS family protein [Geminicoccus harenae]
MARSSAADRSQTEVGWLFAASFRPFFFGTAAYAAAAIPIWLWLYLSGIDTVAGIPALRWHAHEMVLGFLPAIMAGYLLSATPNWSGRLPVSGIPLLCLFAVWLAGRLLPLFVPPPLGTVLDALFPLTMAALFLQEALVAPRKGSRHGLILFPILAVATAADRIFANDPELAAFFSRLGIAIGALLIAAVGGRLVPSFTRTDLAARGERDKVPEPYGRFDLLVLLAASAGLFAWVAIPFHPVTAILAIGAAILHVIRLARWRGWLLRAFDTLALHLGYAWLAAGTLLVGLAADPIALVPPDAALHAYTAGAIGTMTLAVMARLATTRGPGKRPQRGCCMIALLLVNLGAALRTAAPLLPDAYAPLLIWSGLAWSGGFAAFVLSALLPAPKPERQPAAK